MKNTLATLCRLGLMAGLAWMAAAIMPGDASAQINTVTGTAGNDQICVYYETTATYNVACVNGSVLTDALGVPLEVQTPLTINGLGGDDEITVYEDSSSTGGCTCDAGCSPTPDDFVYAGGTVTIRGHGGADELAGGAGEDVIFGSHGDDVLIGSGSVDELYGEEDEDAVTDLGGDSADELYGQDDADCMGDCSVSGSGACEGGPGFDSKITCSGCTAEVTSANCNQTCPE